MTDKNSRIVALGASNLTRGFPSFVATSCLRFGPQVAIFAALGHGRSYGSRSRVLVRELPSVLDCGIWRALESQPAVPTLGLITDVGNDILYGFSVEQTLAWVEETLRRLECRAQSVVMTDLPLASIRRMSPLKYLLLRSILVPSCRLSLAEVSERAGQLSAGLAKLARLHRVELIRPPPDWYGHDPIHIRRSVRRLAWQEIFGIAAGKSQSRLSLLEGLKIHLMRPERRWISGIEQYTPQPGITLTSGCRIWLY